MPCEFGSINQIHKRLNDNGYYVSIYLLRRLVDDGSLPAIESGKKQMISYDSVVQLLRARTAIPNQV